MVQTIILTIACPCHAVRGIFMNPLAIQPIAAADVILMALMYNFRHLSRAFHCKRIPVRISMIAETLLVAGIPSITPGQMKLAYFLLY